MLPSLVALPLKDASGLCQVPIGTEHPFVAAVGSSADTETLTATAVVLEKFYAAFTPETVAEYVGAESSPMLAEWPAYAYVAPWWAIEPMERVRAKQRAYFSEAAWIGWKNSGPATPTLIRQEAQRLIAVKQSISSHGYLSRRGRDGDVRAEWLLSKGHPPRWLIQRGDHRAAVAFSCGITTIPVRILGCIRESDAPFWPNVKNGLWSLHDALTFFRRVARGEMPPNTTGWLKS